MAFVGMSVLNQWETGGLLLVLWMDSLGGGILYASHTLLRGSSRMEV